MGREVDTSGLDQRSKDQNKASCIEGYISSSERLVVAFFFGQLLGLSTQTHPVLTSSAQKGKRAR
jgi:hypothetical protein